VADNWNLCLSFAEQKQDAFLNIFVANAFISPFHHTNNAYIHIKPFYTRQHCYVPLILKKMLNGLFTQTGIFSVGCDCRIQHRTKIGLFLSLDAAVASGTENHCPCK
jgi:hypothetical protein